MLGPILLVDQLWDLIEMLSKGSSKCQTVKVKSLLRKQEFSRWFCHYFRTYQLLSSQILKYFTSLVHLSCHALDTRTKSDFSQKGFQMLKQSSDSRISHFFPLDWLLLQICSQFNTVYLFIHIKFLSLFSILSLCYYQCPSLDFVI